MAFVILGRSTALTAFSRLRSHGFMVRPTLIDGANSEAADIITGLRKNPAAGYVFIGYLTCPRPAGRGRRRPEASTGAAAFPASGMRMASGA